MGGRIGLLFIGSASDNLGVNGRPAIPCGDSSNLWELVTLPAVSCRPSPIKSSGSVGNSVESRVGKSGIFDPRFFSDGLSSASEKSRGDDNPVKLDPQSLSDDVSELDSGLSIGCLPAVGYSVAATKAGSLYIEAPWVIGLPSKIAGAVIGTMALKRM